MCFIITLELFPTLELQDVLCRFVSLAVHDIFMLILSIAFICRLSATCRKTFLSNNQPAFKHCCEMVAGIDPDDPVVWASTPVMEVARSKLN